MQLGFFNIVCRSGFDAGLAYVAYCCNGEVYWYCLSLTSDAFYHCDGQKVLVTTMDATTATFTEAKRNAVKWFLRDMPQIPPAQGETMDDGGVKSTAFLRKVD